MSPQWTWSTNCLFVTLMSFQSARTQREGHNLIKTTKETYTYCVLWRYDTACTKLKTNRNCLWADWKLKIEGNNPNMAGFEIRKLPDKVCHYKWTFQRFILMFTICTTVLSGICFIGSCIVCDDKFQKRWHNINRGSIGVQPIFMESSVQIFGLWILYEVSTTTHLDWFDKQRNLYKKQWTFYQQTIRKCWREYKSIEWTQRTRTNYTAVQWMLSNQII